jgi:N6-adenosine-specific RNA methylase IME4
MKKYNIIYADPPWAYKQAFKSSKTCIKHIDEFYPVMTTKELCELPVKNICADDAVCFMWVCDGWMHDAIHILESWGFKYKVVAFVWDKQAVRPGMWTMKNTELVLLGTKGKMHKFLKKRNIQQLVQERRTTHSTKPEIFKSKIVEMFGDLSRIELFARQKTEGWDIWGNELENSIELRR